MQSCRLMETIDLLHITLAENCLGAGCFDHVVKAAEKDHSLTADFDLRACHASPPSQEISATGETGFGGRIPTANGSDPQLLLITYNFTIRAYCDT